MMKHRKAFTKTFLENAYLFDGWSWQIDVCLIEQVGFLEKILCVRTKNRQILLENGTYSTNRQGLYLFDEQREEN